MNAPVQNYNEATVTGKRWTRAVSVHIENPHNAPAFMTIAEEDIIAVGDETVTRSNMDMRRANITLRFENPEAEFELVDPVTGKNLGTASHSDVHVILYSLYRDLAAKRDAAVVQAAIDAKAAAEAMEQQLKDMEAQRLEQERLQADQVARMAKEQQEMANTALVAAQAEAARQADALSAAQAAAAAAAASTGKDQPTP